MLKGLIKIIGLVLCAFGLFLCYEAYLSYSGGYWSRRGLPLPLLMIMAYAGILYAESFEHILLGLSFYIQLMSIFALMAFVYIAYTIL